VKAKLFKGALVVLFATIISTVGIFAADTFQGVNRNLTNLAGVNSSGSCPQGMVLFKNEGGLLCVDVYEATPAETCPHQSPSNILESEKNASTGNCFATSVAKKIPWSYISLPQAQRMCAQAGKRLPTSDEWYMIALGTNPEMCLINTTAPQSTGTDNCKSAGGAFDTVGNVWEWVNETVVGNTYDDRPLPDEGYVTSVDASGVAITSAEKADSLYGEDYIWSKPEGVFGMIRGGFYGSKTDAGLYTINASVLTSFASQGVGFRCVKDVI